jgi:putative hydrolase of the HAD superfamily
LTNGTTPHAIFFDMDGTILDWTTGMEESWLASCEAHCRDDLFVPAEMHAAIRERRTWFWNDPVRAKQGRMDLDASAREIVRHAFTDRGIEAAELAHKIADDYRARRLKLIVPYVGAVETLKTLRERGVRTALLTNGEARNQRRSVELHALEQYFDCIVIEGEFGVGKPDERVFWHALESCDARPETTWMVGDSLEADIAPAVALGMHAVWVDELGNGVPEGVAIRPHRVIRAITELL